MTHLSHQAVQHEPSAAQFDYHTFSADFKRIQNDLTHTGFSFLTLGGLLLFLLASIWYQEKTLITLTAFALGGTIGSLIPWIGIEKSSLVEYFGEPKHTPAYSHKLQIVIWKFRNHTVMLLSTLPFFLWILKQTIFQTIPAGDNYFDGMLIALLSSVCLFCFSMGILSLQVHWSLRQEIRKHKRA